MTSRFTLKIFSAILALILILANIQPAFAQTENSPSDPVEMEAFFDAYLAEQMGAYHIPGVVISVVKDGQVFFSKGYGYADVEKQIPFDENTLLTTASLGKAFTAVGMLQLSEHGVIDLREDIRPYFKDFTIKTNFDDPLTFANLLTHTDGFETRTIGVATQNENELKPLGELLATYKPNQILPAGKYLTYGDYAANLAGYLTQEISDTPFEQYMDENILSPLGMSHSTFDQHLTQSMKDSLATGYSYENGEYQPEPFLYVSYAPAGGLRTTAADMNHFMLALLNSGEYEDTRILNPDTVQSMFTQQFTGQADMPGITYGLFEDFKNGQRALLRDGDGIGTRTRLLLLPEQNTGIFISYNSGDSNLRLNLLGAYLDHYYPAENSAPIPVDDYQACTKLFAGTYRPLQADVSTFAKSMYFFSQLVDVTANVDGTLTIQSAGMGDHSSVMGGFEGATQWIETSPLHFERVDGDSVIAFIQNENGEIVQMISGQGYHSTFTKLAWYESQSFQMNFIGLAALVLLTFGVVVFLLMPIGALVRKLRKQTTAPQSKMELAALIWGGVVTQLLAMTVFQSIGILYAINSIANLPNFVWGISPEIINALNSTYLPVFLSLTLPIFAIVAWVKGWWKFSTRILYTASAIAALMVIWWANYNNLIGFHL
ncbi:MAG: beta-lactamase family protein [Anaerolineales bacterium]|nr:beta-lactamase family protein [Anaerolineales bacterium]